MRTPAPPPDEDDGPSDPESVARAICLQALTQRARTRAELESRLRKRGVPDNAAHAVLTRLTEVGLIDDAVLADGFAQAAHLERGLSARAVAIKLRQRGVAESDVQAAVSRIDSVSERGAALALAERKLHSLAGLDPQVQLRRLVNLLARRGYSPGLAYSITREVLADDRLGDVDVADVDT
jgi:regulatory protein